MIFGAIDSLESPGHIGGWVRQRRHGRAVDTLRLELRRGSEVLAALRPTTSRPDVDPDTLVALGFVLDCTGLASVAEVLDGAVVLIAIDADGLERPLDIYAPVRSALRQALALDALRQADRQSVLPILDALSTNPALSAAAAALSVVRTTLARDRATMRHAGSGPRIVLVGAGSTVFARALLGDILSEPALSASRICLTDIDPERLRVSGVVAQRIAETLGATAVIETTADLGRALDGADYVISMIQVGGYRPCTVTDFEIPRRHGLQQTIGDTLGIGGIMRGLRTIPVLLGLVREMEQRCPSALHLTTVNPLAMTCMALSRASPVRTIGLCHGIHNTVLDLARDTGVAAGEIDFLAAGINHMAFFLQLSCKGEDLYPRLRRRLAEGQAPPHDRVRYDLLGRVGYFVSESSEHFAEYVPWYLRRDRPGLTQQLNIPVDEYPRRCEQQIAAWNEQARLLQDRSVPLAVARSHEYAAGIINARETGTPTVVYGNVPNNRLIDNLPEAACVELPCLVDGSGVHPVAVGRLPPQLAGLMQTNISVQVLTVEAALTGNRAHVHHAAMLDPRLAAELDLDQIGRLVDELLEAHRPWLPAALFA